MYGWIFPFHLCWSALWPHQLPWSVGLREGFWQVLNFSPTQVGCSLSTLFFESIDKYRKNYLWRGSDFRRKGYNLVAWNMVMKPKDKGGLGVIKTYVYKMMLCLSSSWTNSIEKKTTSGSSLSGTNITLVVLPILEGKKDHFDGRIFLGFILFTEVLLFCIPNIGDTVSF